MSKSLLKNLKNINIEPTQAAYLLSLADEAARDLAPNIIDQHERVVESFRDMLGEKVWAAGEYRGQMNKLHDRIQWIDDKGIVHMQIEVLTEREIYQNRVEFITRTHVQLEPGGKFKITDAAKIPVLFAH